MNTAGLESSFTIDVYRLGYYGGMGARHVAQIIPTADEVTLANKQPACIGDATGLVDCGNWSVTGSWAVPADATSGIYIVMQNGNVFNWLPDGRAHENQPVPYANGKLTPFPPDWPAPFNIEMPNKMLNPDAQK